MADLGKTSAFRRHGWWLGSLLVTALVIAALMWPHKPDSSNKTPQALGPSSVEINPDLLNSQELWGPIRFQLLYEAERRKKPGKAIETTLQEVFGERIAQREAELLKSGFAMAYAYGNNVAGHVFFRVGSPATDILSDGKIRFTTSVEISGSSFEPILRCEEMVLQGCSKDNAVAVEVRFRPAEIVQFDETGRFQVKGVTESDNFAQIAAWRVSKWQGSSAMSGGARDR